MSGSVVLLTLLLMARSPSHGVAAMLGSPRSARRFALQVDELASRAPFSVRIVVVGEVKRYVKSRADGHPDRRTSNVFGRSQRAGPERGIDTFAVGIEKQRDELHRQLELSGGGEGTIKFLRGSCSCGKTFMARLALLDAQERGFATSVVVSDNDLKFHRFDDVYRKVMTELGTSSCVVRWRHPRSLDRSGGRRADRRRRRRRRCGLRREGAAALEADLASLTGGQHRDFIRVIQTIFRLKQEATCQKPGR